MMVTAIVRDEVGPSAADSAVRWVRMKPQADEVDGWSTVRAMNSAKAITNTLSFGLLRHSGNASEYEAMKTLLKKLPNTAKGVLVACIGRQESAGVCRMLIMTNM